MENFASLVPLVIIFPLVGMLINIFFGKNMGERAVGYVATLAAGLAFCVALIMTIAIAGNGFQANVVNMPLIGNWITIPGANVTIPWQLRVDTLSLTMMLVVTGVGTLIHIYAIGYMHGDSRFPRFFQYLNLFLMFMLILVTGNNFLVTFVGWEGVGLCSFLLIGFWFDKTRGEGWRNSNAARKAFIVNRVGDFGFLVAIFLTFWTFGTLDYYKPGETPYQPELTAHIQSVSFAQNGGIGSHGVFILADQWLQDGNRNVNLGPYTLPLTTVVTLITLFMLLGVTGKSAQIPLFVWLPDAMAGPTPVSALIHAATMVTAGIFLMVRSNVLFHAAPLTSMVVTVIGSGTALVAGYIALGQWDIKKVLAYSTVSQLGFMVAAVGLGGYTAAMFHLVTHAFFKALLFLGSGSVIHGMEHGEHLAHEAHAVDNHGHAQETEHEAGDAAPAFDAQDMRNMGGLRSKMPVTFWTYLIGTLALAGIFPFAGFWSKDEIIGHALYAATTEGRLEGWLALVLLIVAAGFTAFYMWRQINLVFLGTPRTEAADHAVESNSFMTLPLVILAVLSVLGGLLNFPWALPGLAAESLGKALEATVSYASSVAFNPILALFTLVVALGSIWLAHSIYGKRAVADGNHDPLEAGATRGLFEMANGKLYFDEFYGALIEQPYNRAAKWLADKLDWQFWHDYIHNSVIVAGFNGMAAFLSGPFDKGFIDGGFMDIGKGIQWLGRQIKRIQTGYVRTYAFTVLIGVLLVLLLILLPLIRQVLQR